MIKKRGNKFVLLNKTGNQVLGRHKTKRAAKAQERAIQHAKKRRKRS